MRLLSMAERFGFLVLIGIHAGDRWESLQVTALDTMEFCPFLQWMVTSVGRPGSKTIGWIITASGRYPRQLQI